MQIVSNVALISINETLLIQLISFLIFLFIIDRIMIRPLRETMDERESYIHQMKTEISDAEEKYAQAIRDIKKQEAAARIEATELSREHETAGSHEAGKIIESARTEIFEMKKAATLQVDHQLAEARIRIKAESEILATAIIENVLERRITS